MMTDENIENSLIIKDKYVLEIEEECIFCQEPSPDLIEYEHTCGRYKIHQECLDKWFESNKTSCIICRKDILTPENSPINSDLLNREHYILAIRTIRELNDIQIDNPPPTNMCRCLCACLSITSVIIILATFVIK
jgi:hypothetical protein